MDAPLEIRQLRAFVSVARSGSFTRAAARLNLTQSAVSHALRGLQDQLGCPLLYKSGRRVHLSPQGEVLLRTAERVLAEVDGIPQQLRALERLDRGRLRVGCSAAGSQFILPPVLREFKECFPGFDLAVRPGDTPEIQAMLLAGELDLAIALRLEEMGPLDGREIFVDELSFLVSPMHPWAGRSRVSRKQMEGQTYIVYQRGSVTFRLVEEYFLKLGVRPGSLIELGSMEAIKELVKLGLGIGVTASWIARAELEAGSILTVELRPKIRRRWMVLWMKGRPLNLAEETFVGLSESVGANVV
ncbi:MAG: LysR family transcriptional regulator [Verrucomicrobiia bacterium]